MSDNEIKEPKKSELKVLYHTLSEEEKQKLYIDKLMKNVDRPIEFIVKKKDRNSLLPPVKDINNNVQGSSAGAGSGEFHVYRASRRREFTRIAQMNSEIKREKEIEEFNNNKQELIRQAEEKTAKNRAKRQKRKSNSKSKSSPKSKAQLETISNTTTFKMVPCKDSTVTNQLEEDKNSNDNVDKSNDE